MNRDVLKASNYPANADAWNRLGLAYSRVGRPAEEIAAYRQGLVHAPRNRYLLKNLGAALYEAGRLPEAREALSAALAESSSHLHSPDLQAAKIVYNLALVLMRQGEAAEAARLLEQALEEAGRLPGELRQRMADLKDRARRTDATR
jgi:Tfp pilus assembly protein PilF